MDPLLHPSLAAVLAANGMDPDSAKLGTPLAGGSGGRGRGTLFLVAGEAVATWEVPALSALFRGNRAPPDMTEFPPEYVPVFYQIERHLLVVAPAGRVPTDAELEEVYGNLRRRPGGRSLGPLHDAVWQASAFALGTFVLSEAEYCAVIGRLARSARRWKLHVTSREYVGYLRRTFE